MLHFFRDYTRPIVLRDLPDAQHNAFMQCGIISCSHEETTLTLHLYVSATDESLSKLVSWFSLVHRLLNVHPPELKPYLNTNGKKNRLCQ